MQHTPIVGGRRRYKLFPQMMLEALNVFKLRLRKPARALFTGFGAGVADVGVPTHCVVYCDAKVLN